MTKNLLSKFGAIVLGGVISSYNPSALSDETAKDSMNYSNLKCEEIEKRMDLEFDIFEKYRLTTDKIFTSKMITERQKLIRESYNKKMKDCNSKK